MRLTQGCFSFLPDLTDEQIEKQIAYAISKGWAMNEKTEKVKLELVTGLKE